MTRTLIALAAAAMSIAGATGAAAQAVYIEDEYALPAYTAPPPVYAVPPVYGAPVGVYVARPVYAVAPPAYVTPAPTYRPRGYSNRPRTIYDASYGYVISGP
jgi:hypothetical protein